ncbi:unnamed protein product [Hyaloperonospora brassicae]|uniref:Uncharacterized protein n=1 Tax=Hyaloperonospora brassicae TaxID=162125 RepID=A0AAV0V1Q4_HYABA|nr:unnamed protein product [Hyaloperonospora brassicae]
MSRRVPRAELPEENDVDELLRQEAAYRKEFEPVAPWKRDNIPDYGPLQEHHHVLIFGVVGTACTIFYEFTDYFSEIHRLVAYVAIWAPLWFRLLGRVSPAPTDEELDARERREFERNLQRIADEKDKGDDD